MNHCKKAARCNTNSGIPAGDPGDMDVRKVGQEVLRPGGLCRLSDGLVGIRGLENNRFVPDVAHENRRNKDVSASPAPAGTAFETKAGICS